MHLSRIPVSIVASKHEEYQAIADVLQGGQAGALVLPQGGESPLAIIVCPSGEMPFEPTVPCVVLGPRRDDESELVHTIAIPASLAEIFTEVETMSQSAALVLAPRHKSGWALDPMRLELMAPDARTISLTDTETRLMTILFDADGHELDKTELLQRVWGYRPGLDTHTLETHIYRLRQKIETNPTNPQFLMTTEEGYKLA